MAKENKKISTEQRIFGMLLAVLLAVLIYFNV